MGKGKREERQEKLNNSRQKSIRGGDLNTSLSSFGRSTKGKFPLLNKSNLLEADEAVNSTTVDNTKNKEKVSNRNISSSKKKEEKSPKKKRNLIIKLNDKETLDTKNCNINSINNNNKSKTNQVTTTLGNDNIVSTVTPAVLPRLDSNAKKNTTSNLSPSSSNPHQSLSNDYNTNNNSNNNLSRSVKGNKYYPTNSNYLALPRVIEEDEYKSEVPAKKTKKKLKDPVNSNCNNKQNVYSASKNYNSNNNFHYHFQRENDRYANNSIKTQLNQVTSYEQTLESNRCNTLKDLRLIELTSKSEASSTTINPLSLPAKGTGISASQNSLLSDKHRLNPLLVNINGNNANYGKALPNNQNLNSSLVKKNTLNSNKGKINENSLPRNMKKINNLIGNNYLTSQNQSSSNYNNNSSNSSSVAKFNNLSKSVNNVNKNISNHLGISQLNNTNNIKTNSSSNLRDEYKGIINEVSGSCNSNTSLNQHITNTNNNISSITSNNVNNNASPSNYFSNNNQKENQQTQQLSPYETYYTVSTLINKL